MFRDQPIKFRTTTAAALGKLPRSAQLERLATLCRDNAAALYASLEYCAGHGIGCFRINSQILPLRTHPQVGYQIVGLPTGPEIIAAFRRCGEYAQRHALRTCFHPDQFVVLNSPRPEVVASSIAELEYQAEVAEWVGADVVNIHGGGAYGDKPAALARFAQAVEGLSPRVRSRLTVENDDKVFTPADLLPICKATGVPLVYDVHHHRCLPDGLTIEQATKRARATWDREPMFHISSPLAGWQGSQPERHHDLIDVADFPECWRRKDLTVEVEAKAKEVAVAKLLSDLCAAASPSAWYVYLVRCADDSLYTGIATDVDRRCQEHNAGTASRYTRTRLPVQVVYRESHPDRSAASKREYALKQLSRAQKEALIQSQRANA